MDLPFLRRQEPEPPAQRVYQRPGLVQHFLGGGSPYSAERKKRRVKEYGRYNAEKARFRQETRRSWQDQREQLEKGQRTFFRKRGLSELGYREPTEAELADRNISEVVDDFKTFKENSVESFWEQRRGAQRQMKKAHSKQYRAITESLHDDARQDRLNPGRPVPGGRSSFRGRDSWR